MTMPLDEFMAQLGYKKPAYRFYYRSGENGEKTTNTEAHLIVDAALTCQTCGTEFVIEDVDAVLAALLCGVAPRFDCGTHQAPPTSLLVQ